ncbi:MAG: calcineurin-like phosphoesterase [Paenibacillaceae bacterium]|nr:calcineurin-like phosphoesterase [Paenibacillaceae bacterium]
MMSRRRFLKGMLLSLGIVTGGIIAVLEFVTGKRFALFSQTVPVSDAPEQGGEVPVSRPVGEAAVVEQAEPQAEETASNELLLSFFLLSDMHISMDQPIMTDKLHWALKDLTNFESKVDMIVFGGDLTDFGRDGDYDLLKSTMAQYKLPPFYGNMGNHDYYDIWLDQKNGWFSEKTMPNGKTDAMARNRFLNFIGYKDGNVYKDVYVNGVHLIMVSQECYVQEKRDVGEGAWYKDDQLDWLKKAMEPHKDGSPAIVFIHQPLPSQGGDGRTHQLIRATEFRAIMEPYKNVVVLSGHTHWDFNVNNHDNPGETFRWFNNSAVGPCRGDSTRSSKRSQGMYVQVYKDKIHVRGREFSDRSWIESADWEVPIVKV